MTVATRREGPRAPLFYAAAAALTLVAVASSAQPIERADMELCAKLSTPAARLACFEGLLVDPDLEDDAPEPAVAPVVDEKAQAPEPAAAPAAAASKVSSRPRPDDEFGREHIERQDKKRVDEIVTATVSQVGRDSRDRLLFYMANGQVWRQMERRRFQYPKSGAFDVEITRGIMGDYQLRIDGEGRMTRIVRVE